MLPRANYNARNYCRREEGLLLSFRFTLLYFKLFKLISITARLCFYIISALKVCFYNFISLKSIILYIPLSSFLLSSLACFFAL